MYGAEWVVLLRDCAKGNRVSSCGCQHDAVKPTRSKKERDKAALDGVAQEMGTTALCGIGASGRRSRRWPGDEAQKEIGVSDGV